MIRSWVCAGVMSVCALGLAAAPAAAQDVRSAAAEPTATSSLAPSRAPSTAELVERLEALQRRVDALEAQLAVAQAAAREVASPAAPAATAVASHAQMPHDDVPPAVQPEQYPSLHIRGFGNVNFVKTSDGRPDGFQLGQFVLHMASALNSKVSVFAETSLAPRAPAAGQPSGYVADVERAIIRYDHGDAFKLSFGRYHTPIGYWNNAFHHGMFLQTTISRPEMIQFGTAFQPVHFVGVLAEGTLPRSPLGLAYRAGIGNGRSPNGAGDGGDANDHRAWVANLLSHPERVTSLELGVSVYRDRYTTQPGTPVDEWIAGAHVAWTNETPEVIAEFTNVRHTVIATGRTFDSPAYYLQTAYRLPWHGARWKPYYRFENINTPEDEPVVGDFGLWVSTTGLRYDLADFAAFKGEYRRIRRQLDGDPSHGWFVQTSFTF